MDEQLRTLERAAAQGDTEAQQQLERQGARCGSPWDEYVGKNIYCHFSDKRDSSGVLRWVKRAGYHYVGRVDSIQSNKIRIVNLTLALLIEVTP
jgi:hypothetical protein